MFPNFASLRECTSVSGAACLLSPQHLLIYAMMLVALALGYMLARRIGPSRRIFANLLGLGLVTLALAGAAVAAFLLYGPEASLGTERRPGFVWLWQVASAGVGFGVTALLTAVSFRAGRTLARLTGYATRLGKPGIVIAIDGPAASGKGTLAKRIAEHYRMPCLDTGLLYRAVARDVAKTGASLEDTAEAVKAAARLDPRTFNDPALRGEAAGEAASIVAKIPDVRAALLDYQRNFAASPFGAVLDGRDIGTVVCPQADVKIFVVASPEERARRRHRDHVARGDTVSYETVLEDIHRRDARDMGREVAPLWAAKDAITLDTTELSPEQAFNASIRIIEKRIAGDAA